MANKIVVDTNVFIEGIFSEETSDSEKLLASLDKWNARLVFSQETIGELMYIIKRQANELGMDASEVKDVLLMVSDFFQSGKSINTRHLELTQIEEINDPDDQMFVRAAYASEATHLITLDRKSGILELSNTPFVCCTPSEFLKHHSHHS